MRLLIKNVLGFSIKSTKLTVLIASLILSSCNSEYKKMSPERLIIKMQKKQKAGVPEYGEIIYKSDVMDTLKLREQDFRQFVFRYGVYDRQYSVEELTKKETIAYRGTDDSIIPFDVKIEAPGFYYVEGYIDDSIYLHNYYREGKSRKIITQVKISHKVEVTE